MTNKLTRNGKDRVVRGAWRVVGVERDEKCSCIGELRVNTLIERKFKFYNFALGEYQSKIEIVESIYDDFRPEGITDLKEILSALSKEPGVHPRMATVVAEDGDKWYITPGVHLVNRVGYVIYVCPDNDKLDNYYCMG